MARGGRYARVIVDIAHANVDRVYTYAIPEDMEPRQGTRVIVPFGPRKVEGFVISLSPEPDVDESKLRYIIRPLDDFPALLPEVITLALWIRDKYRCLLVDALRLMIPSQMRGGRVREKTHNVARLTLPDGQLEAALEAQGRSEKRREVLRLLSDNSPMPSALVAKLIPGAAGALRQLAKLGLVAIETVALRRAPYSAIGPAGAPPHTLLPAQRSAVREITYAMDHHGEAFLLSGVTGSGKTEVYMHCIRHALATGKAAIMLVPEIALTPQMVSWFRARFGDGAAVLHSRLSPGERYDEWLRIRHGQARVVVGARSAVFAPAERLGLIIVDEEHEQSYQSESRPRYDAREVARWRCERAGAALVMGSATPSIVSFMRTQPGVRPENALTLIEMPDRVNGRPLPSVELVDMRGELARGNRSIFSGALDSALRECFAAGKQAMLFINRRGHSTFVSCRACGYVVKCAQCDVSMTYHQSGEMMRCHYCDAFEPPPAKCPGCGSRFIKFFGVGTQKVEEELSARYPNATSLRMDNDTTRGKDAHQKILDAFRAGQARVLIGTQMIAKGLDFPNVTVVGVVAADMSLNLPDYRAPERTFQLITQVAGRAGRADSPGLVIAQTYDPDHYTMRLAAAQDYRAFYVVEADRRRRGLYPPYTMMVRILASGDDSAAAQTYIEGCEAEMAGFFADNPALNKQVVQMRGMAAPVERIRGKARWQLFLKLYARGPSDEVLAKLRELETTHPEGLSVDLEVNPANMM